MLLVVVLVVGAYAVVRIRDTLSSGGAAHPADANADNTKPFNPNTSPTR